jgi:hypothetical protein
MRFLTLILIVATLATMAVSVVPCNAAVNDDQARYQWHGGRWWYWMPDNHWVYWDGGCWIDYRPLVTMTAQATEQAVPAIQQAARADTSPGNSRSVPAAASNRDYSGYSVTDSWTAGAVGSWGGNYFGRSIH